MEAPATPHSFIVGGATCWCETCMCVCGRVWEAGLWRCLFGHVDGKRVRRVWLLMRPNANNCWRCGFENFGETRDEGCQTVATVPCGPNTLSSDVRRLV